MGEQLRCAPRPHTLQVHVTRRCNLRCLHCYSSSGPEARGELSLDLLRGALDDASELGYGVVAVSGGEPLLYRPLPDLLAHARRRGLATAMTTNGMFLDRRHLEPLKGVLAFVAVSLDGTPAAHDRMRARPGAFAAMAERLPELRASGIPFGILFTLTNENAEDLAWAADFAVANGAVALQVHPLSLTGRAAETDLAPPDAALAVRAARLAAEARDRHGRHLRIVVDYVPWLWVTTDGPAPARAEGSHRPLFADLVSSLAIEADGTVIPIGHGFARDHALGNLGGARLSALADRWIATGAHERFRELIRRVAAEVGTPAAPPLLNWADAMRRASVAEYVLSPTVD
jgi:MoaA/NifB/PqqE/SkfB family radical SAM enzyme